MFELTDRAIRTYAFDTNTWKYQVIIIRVFPNVKELYNNIKTISRTNHETPVFRYNLVVIKRIGICLDRSTKGNIDPTKD